jgi:hypothetical protein
MHFVVCLGIADKKSMMLTNNQIVDCRFFFMRVEKFANRYRMLNFRKLISIRFYIFLRFDSYTKMEVITHKRICMYVYKRSQVVLISF